MRTWSPCPATVATRADPRDRSVTKLLARGRMPMPYSAGTLALTIGKSRPRAPDAPAL